MTFFAGLRGTGSFGTDERPKNFREAILWAEPNGRAPMTALSAKMKSQSIDDPEHSWWEEVLKPAVVYVNDAGGYNTVDTVWTVDHGPGTHPTTDTTLTGLQYAPGDVLLVEEDNDPADNELVRVASVNAAGTQITVVRSVAGSTAQSISDNTRITRVGSSFGEGTLSPATVTSNPTKLTNYAEIQKTAFQVSNTARATKFRTGDPLKNDRKRKMFTHAEKHEFASIFGRPSETTDSNGQPIRTMGGIRYYLSSHVTIFSADPTEDTFISAVQGVFDYDAGGAGNERIGFIGNGALMYLNQIVRDSTQVRINFDGTIKAYGMELMRFVLPMGTIGFKSHPLFNVHPRLTNSMIIVNPAGITRMPLSGRDTKEEKNIQPNDADYLKNQWIDEMTMELAHERTFAYIGEFRDFP